MFYIFELLKRRFIKIDLKNNTQYILTIWLAVYAIMTMEYLYAIVLI